MSSLISSPFFPRLVAFVLIGGATFLEGTARAKEEMPAPTSVLVANLPLSLDDCRRLALAHNLGLRAQRETLLAAGFLRKAELGVFEPEFVASVSKEYNQRKNTIEQTISQGTTVFE